MSVFAPPRTQDEPPWVRCWRAARKNDDTRAFVEQIPAMAEAPQEDAGNLPIPPETFTDKKVWIQPGEYGYKMCAYDFGAPVDNNRLCVMHPHLPTKQPLARAIVGGMSFMLCLDCKTCYERRQKEREALAAPIDWRDA